MRLTSSRVPAAFDSHQIEFRRIIFLLALMFFASSTYLDAATITIRVGYPQLNGGQTPLWNIPESKLDQKYGVNVKPVYIPGGVRLTQSVVSGSVDVALTGEGIPQGLSGGAQSCLRAARRIQTSGREVPCD